MRCICIKKSKTEKNNNSSKSESTNSNSTNRESPLNNQLSEKNLKTLFVWNELEWFDQNGCFCVGLFFSFV